MASSASLNQIQDLYIGYFGRPADPVGLAYWAQVADANGGNLANVVAGFAAAPESQALFGGLTAAQEVSAIYQNLFNRAPEAGGLVYWTTQINSGAVSASQAAWTILQSAMLNATSSDALSITNKLAAANAFTADIDTPNERVGYSGSNAIAIGRSFLAKVDSSAASIANLTNDANIAVGQATGNTVGATGGGGGSSVTIFAFKDSGNAVTFTGAGAAITELAGGGSATFTSNGNSNTISGTIASINVLTGTVLTLNNNSLSGVNFPGVGSLKMSDAITTSALDTSVISNSITLTLANVTGNSLTLVDATVPAGKTLTIDGSSVTSAITINGGAETNGTLVITGGSGADTITDGQQPGTLTGGGGIDNFIFNAANRSTLSSLHTIADYRAAGGANAGAADTITISDITTVAGNINTVQDLSAQASLAAALNVFANAATTSNGLGVFIWGGNEYAYVETTGSTTTYVAGDTVIKLTGTPFTAGTSIVGLGIDGV